MVLDTTTFLIIFAATLVMGLVGWLIYHFENKKRRNGCDAPHAPRALILVAGPDTLIPSDLNMESDDGKRYCEVVQSDERLWVYSTGERGWEGRFRSHLGR